jgi:hypothetical protein
MVKRLCACGAFAASLSMGNGTLGQEAALSQTATPRPNDYSDARSWLCRPGRHDACDVDLTTTVIGADGRLTRETWRGNPNAPVDCFYVYPTVSTDETANSDMTADPAELNVIRQQFARFGSKCRTYAPLYRQVTLTGLRRLLTGGGGALDRGLQYDDVRDAWHYYLEHDNHSRGFVLVGHSQGSFILSRLIREEIDGKPVQARMLSSMLVGTTLAVARGQDVGGAFQKVPLCRAAVQTGCVITFATFRSTAPPPPNTLFGRISDPSMTAACTNPAALGGGEGELHAYLSADGRTIVSTTKPPPWIVPERPIPTPWVSVPGLLTARCVSNENATYLEVTVHGDRSQRRTGDIVGDLSVGGSVQAAWGLHLVDMNLGMGNLVEIVDRQSNAYVAGRNRK